MKKFWLLAIPAALCAAAVVSACASDDAAEAETYKVVYMNGDEVFFSAKVTAGEELPVPENDPERADEGNIVYTFAGWTDDAEGGVGDVVDLDEVTAVTSDLTYYAVFDAVSYYTVTFMDGVTGLPIDEQKVPAGGDAVAPEKVPEHEGYEFVEWDGSFTDISARTTVTAVYKKLSYTLSLDVLGVITETPVEYGAALAPAAPATVAGLKFDGWYIKGEEGEPVLLSEAYKSMPAHAVEAYAEFSVDWTGVGIALPANAVYGGEGATIAHPAYGNMTYTHIWGDESRGDSYIFGGAGLQTVSATVIAVFENENGAYISERRSFEKTVNVGKAELEITASVANLSNGSVVYGTAPAAEFTFSGFVGEDDSSDLGSVSAVYTFENGQPADAEKLEAGAYIISASLEDDNYIANVRTSLFLVKPRDITLTLTAGDITYGAQPEFTVSADKSQFAYGEDISVLRQGTVVIKKDGAVVSGNLAAGSYTAETDGYKNANYNVIPGTAQFTVKKAALTATVSVEDSYEYGTEVKPGLSYEGFVFGDDEKVLTAQTVVSFAGAPDVSGLLTAGDYTVTANGATADNYTIEYKYTNEKFTVKPLGLRVTISATGVSGVKWRGAVTNAALELDGRFIVSGEIALKDEYTKAAIYAGLGNGMGEYFEWSQALKITLNGIDVTDNFVVNSYSLYVELKNSAFKVTSTGEVNTPYTGSPITLGTGVDVEGAPAGMKIEYSLDGNSWSEDIPTATEAGTYNVHYRLSADNYDEFTGTFTSVISNANNHIEQIAQYDSVIYDGQAHTFADFGTYFKADFGTVTLKTAGSNVFTDAGTYTFVVCVDGNDNYAYAELKVSVTINKAKYTDGQIPEKALKADDVYYHSDVSLNVLGAGDLAEGFSWADGTTYTYVQGLNDNIRFIYNKDSAFDPNYEPIEIFRSFVAYDLINVTVTGGFSGQIDVVTAFTENAYSVLSAEAPYNSGLDISDLSKYISADTSGIDFAVGSTYAVVYTASEAAKTQYCKVMFGGSETGYAPYKLTSVLYDGKYYTIEDAINAATSGSIIVTADTSFAAGEARKFYYTAEGEPDINYYTVKQGVTLLVPYDGNYSTDTKEYQEDTIVAVASEGYVKLTVPTGVNLTINGNLTVNAKRTASKSVTSVVYGSAYGEMEVQSGAYIYLGSTSCFETIGFTYGEGEIVARSGAYVYEPFNMVGWKGGAISTAIQSSVFPLNQYSMTSLGVKTKFEYGSHYYVKAVVKVNMLFFDIVQHADAAFGGTGSDSFIQLRNADSYFYKYVNPADGKHVFEFYGDIQINNMSVSVSGASINTEGKQIPIPGNFRLDVYGKVTIPDGVEIKLLPGAQLNIMPKQQNTSSAGQLLVKSGAALYAYGSKVTYDNNLTKWQDGQNSFTYPHSNLATSYHVKPDLGYNAETLAVVKVDGSLTVESDATFAAEISGGMADSVIVFSDNVTLNKTDLREDYTPYVSSWGTKAVYFYSNITTTFSGSETVVQAGKTYVYDGSGWVEQPAQQA